MITVKEIESVYDHISKDIYKTPLVFASELSKISGANVYLKMEHLQHTGSFKLRGVLSKIDSLDKHDFKKTFVAASTGNHAAAFAYAAQKFGFKGVLFLPEKTSEAKLKALEEFDVEKRFYGRSSMETEEKANTYAKEINGILIHPYNDLKIIAGQATIALEIKNQLPKVDTVLAPIGGGGLISGICLYLKDSPAAKVVGCQPVNAPEMYESIKQNQIVQPSTLLTIADATAGGIEEKAVTFNICKEHLSGIELLDEENIKKAVAFVVKHHQTLIEPASALPVAALLKGRSYQGKNVVLVLTGKKINSGLLTEILNDYGSYY